MNLPRPRPHLSVDLLQGPEETERKFTADPIVRKEWFAPSKTAYSAWTKQFVHPARPGPGSSPIKQRQKPLLSRLCPGSRDYDPRSKASATMDSALHTRSTTKIRRNTRRRVFTLFRRRLNGHLRSPLISGEVTTYQNISSAAPNRFQKRGKRCGRSVSSHGSPAGSLGCGTTRSLSGNGFPVFAS